MPIPDLSILLSAVVLRQAFAGLVGQHVFLCICAVAGIQMNEMHLNEMLPGEPMAPLTLAGLSETCIL